jgi:hypothetical protein
LKAAVALRRRQRRDAVDLLRQIMLGLPQVVGLLHR